MAAPALIGNRLTSITHAATPLPAEVIPGSAQDYEISGSFPNSSGTIFFAPVHEAVGVWDSMMELPNRTLYTYAVPCRYHQAHDFIGGLDSFEWERLSFELMRIASLGPHWDGEGAEAVHQTSVTTAANLLALARSATLDVRHFFSHSLPTIYPTIEGGITLRWVRGERELKCTVLGETVEVVRWRSPDRYESDGLWELDVQGVGEHLAWLLQQ